MSSSKVPSHKALELHRYPATTQIVLNFARAVELSLSQIPQEAEVLETRTLLQGLIQNFPPTVPPALLEKFAENLLKILGIIIEERKTHA